MSRRIRLLLANRLIPLSWALKGSWAPPCAHQLLMIARWLVPQAKRFFIRRIGSHNQNQRTIELAVYLGTLIRRIPPGVVPGFLIVAGFVGALDLLMQTTATETRPLVEKFAFRHEPQDSRISVRESSDVSETASVSEAQMRRFHYLRESLKGSTKSLEEKVRPRHCHSKKNNSSAKKTRAEATGSYGSALS